MATVSEKIAVWVEATGFDDIPAPVVTIARRNIMDLLGVTVAAQDQSITGVIRKYLKEVGGPRQSSVIGLGVKTSPGEAAFANGTIGHCLDYDDFIVPVAGAGGPHITAAVLPAPLALAEKLKSTGKDLITAYVLGCEVCYRVGRGVEPAHYNQGWHNTGTHGVFGATVAAARILGLDRHQIAWALGIAASESSSLRENFGTMTKPLHAGQAAAKGVKAALLAGFGFDSSLTAFEGRYGFCSVMTRNARVEEITEKLGNPFCLENIILKLYPCCGASHTAIQTMLAQVRENKLTASQVEAIEIEVDPQLMTVAVYNEPKTGLEGKFSLQFPFALALAEGRVTLDQFTDEKVKEQKILAIIQKIKVIQNPGLRADDPNVRTAIVRMRLKDGRTIEKRTDARPGSRLNPFSDEDVIEKYRNCLRPWLPQGQIEESVKMLMALDTLDDVSRLPALLKAK